MTRILRTSLLILPLLLAPLVPPAIHAITPQESAISSRMQLQSDDFADRGFSSGFELFYAGPEWFLNALSNPRSRNPFIKSFIIDNAGDRLGAENGYVGTLRDVFDGNLFSNIAFFAGSTGGKASAPTILSIAGNDYYWDVNGLALGLGGTGTWDIGTTANWNDSTGTGTPDVWVNGKNAFFQGSPGTVTLVSGLSADAWNVTVGGYTFTGGDLTVGAGNIAISNPSGTTTVNSLIQGTASLTKTGAGTLTLSGANTYTGETTLNEGVLQLGSNSTGSVTNGPVGTGTLILNGGTLSSDSTTARSIANAITFGGDVILGSSTNFGTLTLGGAGTLTGNRILTLNSDVTYSGNIGESGGSFGIAKAGSGTLKLSGYNTYSGGTTVAAGLLWLNTTGALGSSSGALTVNGGIVDLAGNNVSVGNLTGSGGTIWNNLGPSSAVTLTIGNGNNGGGNYQGVIADTNGASPGSTLALTKTGNGTITLSGANTYTGATTINGGTLLINGSTAAGSAVTVNNSGTLGGTGTVNGTVDVKSGGTLSPGTSPGTLTTGAVTLEAGSIFAVDLINTTVGSGYDQLVTSSITLGDLINGRPSLSLNIGGTLAIGQQFFIVNNTGLDAVSGVFSQGATVTSGGYTFLIDYLADFGSQSAIGGNDIMLEVTAIPEPSTWIGGALALAAIGLMSRKRLAKRSRVIRHGGFVLWRIR